MHNSSGFAVAVAAVQLLLQPWLGTVAAIFWMEHFAMITADITHSTGSYDSEFRTTMVNATTNAELTLVLKLHLDKVTRAAQTTIQDSDNTAFQVLDWTPKGGPASRVQAMGQGFWKGKFWLVSPNGTTDLQVTSAVRT